MLSNSSLPFHHAITWNLVTSCECLFSLPSHIWKSAIESQIFTWKSGPRFSKKIFFDLSGQVAFIHLLTHQNDYFTPTLYSSQISIIFSLFLIIRWQSFFQFHWENWNNWKWISRSSHHHICPSAYNNICTQMSSLL